MTKDRPITASLPRRTLIDNTLIRLFMRRVTVSACDRLSDHFRLIAFEGRSLRKVKWSPGQKVKVILPSLAVGRTYTPIDWDSASGTMRILVYAHGTGPGSDWARTVAPGDECDVLGPKDSMDLLALSGRIVMLGDETSFGLAHAARTQPVFGTMEMLLEVNDIDEARSVAETLGLGPVQLVHRRSDDGHLGAIEQLLPGMNAREVHFVLTGKGRTVQRLRHALKALEVPVSRITTLAYWADGKKGLE